MLTATNGANSTYMNVERTTPIYELCVEIIEEK
jgi:hypothetical protein